MSTRLLRLFTLTFLILSSLAAVAAPPVDYYVTLVNSKQHVVHVRIHLSGTSAERDVQLPAWNALYQIRDFAQNVRSLHARDAGNNELPVRKLDKTSWRISHAESGAEVEYDIYLERPGLVKINVVLDFCAAFRVADSPGGLIEFAHRQLIIAGIPRVHRANVLREVAYLVERIPRRQLDVAFSGRARKVDTHVHHMLL